MEIKTEEELQMLDLQKENELLQKEIENDIIVQSDLIIKNQELEKENEQLKKENEILQQEIEKAEKVALEIADQLYNQEQTDININEDI